MERKISKIKNKGCDILPNVYLEVNHPLIQKKQIKITEIINSSAGKLEIETEELLKNNRIYAGDITYQNKEMGIFLRTVKKKRNGNSNNYIIDLLGASPEEHSQMLKSLKEIKGKKNRGTSHYF